MLFENPFPFFLNLFFSGKMEAMPPKYLIDKGDLMVLRPLSYCKESDIETYSRLIKFPIIPCNLCGSQTNLQRQKIKNQDLIHLKLALE